MIALVLIVPLALLVYHLTTLGTYYIEFDGEAYTVWIRRFMGYNNILAGGYRLRSEKEARERIEEAKNNPPRNINV